MSVLPFTALFVLLLALPIKAQSEAEQEFWPELATYVNLNRDMRLYFQVVGTRENFESTGVNFGVSFDYYLKPLVHPKRFVFFQLDESRTRRLLLRAGFHYITSTSGSPERRIVLEATPRFPLKSGVMV